MPAEAAQSTATWKPWSGQPLDLGDGTRITWEPDPWGLMVVRTDPGRTVAVMAMITNYRIVTFRPHDPSCHDAGWCYFGKGPGTLALALAAARAFTPDLGEPTGYGKRAF